MLCLSRQALEGSCAEASVQPRPKVRETRAALVEHFANEHFVHALGRFAPPADELPGWVRAGAATDIIGAGPQNVASAMGTIPPKRITTTRSMAIHWMQFYQPTRRMIMTSITGLQHDPPPFNRTSHHPRGWSFPAARMFWPLPALVIWCWIYSHGIQRLYLSRECCRCPSAACDDDAQRHLDCPDPADCGACRKTGDDCEGPEPERRRSNPRLSPSA